MKKILLISLALISYVCFANGPGPQHRTNLFKTKSLKSMMDTVGWKWDTILTYDTAGGSLQRITQTFSNVGQVLTQTTEQWKSGAWVNSTRHSYTYDDVIGVMLTDLSELWQNNAWVNNVRDTYTYISADTTVTDVNEQWQNNAWVSNWINTDYYDKSGYKVMRLHQGWQSGAYVNTWRDTYTNDSIGNMLTDLNEQWQSNAWVNYSNETYTYDAHNDMLNWVHAIWRSGAWVNSTKYSFTYDAMGNMLTALYQTWHGSSWVNNSNYIYTNDASGNTISVLWQRWRAAAWTDTTRSSYGYDANNNAINGKYEIWQTSGWQAGIGVLDLFCQAVPLDYVDSVYRYVAKYVPISDGIANIQANTLQLSVYPNPAGEKLTVDYPAFKQNKEAVVMVYNMQGQALLQKTLLQEKSEIYVRSLSQGTYILKLSSGVKTGLASFVKK